ncbi:DUF6894 family protein [Bradyrhizobium sp. AUGA SZCCT0182]|uniref:DUF6894 family protein n=1 Tax=Bradyrhizobium sp. AUGA SZCCT0182 TaxID=2807667 RepID=UPI00390C7DE5
MPSLRQGAAGTPYFEPGGVSFWVRLRDIGTDKRIRPGGTIPWHQHFPSMPHYHFELANGHRIPDPRGLHCRDNEDAIAKAHQIAGAMAAEVGETPRCLVVVDDEGNDLCKVPIALSP